MPAYDFALIPAALRRFVQVNFGWDLEDWEPWEIPF